MNKNLSDFKLELDVIDKENKHYSEEAANRAFKILETIPEITKLQNDLENMQGGEYSLDESGELIYTVEVPSDIADLPFINDYLTKDYGFLTGKKHNDLRLGQFCGGFISICWNHERNQYFVYDVENRKVIIEKKLEWMDERYVAAIIEQYQELIGCFNDVIEVCARYGSYEKHFSTFEALSVNTQPTKEELKKIINEYKNEEQE